MNGVIELKVVNDEVKIKVEGLNPIEVLKLLLGLCQDAVHKIKTVPVEPKRIIRPNFNLDNKVININKAIKN